MRCLVDIAKSNTDGAWFQTAPFGYILSMRKEDELAGQSENYPCPQLRTGRHNISGCSFVLKNVVSEETDISIVFSRSITYWGRSSCSNSGCLSCSDTSKIDNTTFCMFLQQTDNPWTIHFASTIHHGCRPSMHCW